MEHLTDLMDEAKCVQLLEHWRWPDGIRCPLCGSSAVITHTRRYNGRGTRYLCKACRRTFNSCTGTPFAHSNMPLRAWFACGYLMNCRLSTLEIAHELGVAPSTAWRLVRVLMGTLWLTKLAEKKTDPGRGGGRRDVPERGPKGRSGAGSGPQVPRPGRSGPRHLRH